MSDIIQLRQERRDKQRERIIDLQERVTILEGKKHLLKSAAQRRKEEAKKAKREETQKKAKEAAMSALNEEYQERLRSHAEDNIVIERAAAKPFIGFGLVEEENTHGNIVLVVYNVWKGGPADQVGLKPGDVITHIGEHQVNTLDGFRKYYTEECHCGSFTVFKMTRPGQSGETEIPTWIMTNDDKYFGQPFFFDVTKSMKIMKESSSSLEY